MEKQINSEAEQTAAAQEVDQVEVEQKNQNGQRLDVVPTGIAGLDTILGGGIPRGSLVLVMGSPGAGKTVLMHAIAFGWAAYNPSSERKRKVLYFSTVTEPHEKVIAHVRLFSFYDASIIPDDMELLSLQEAMSESIDDVVETIVNTARQRRAGLVVVDGFRALVSLAGDLNKASFALFRLSAQLGMLGTTCVITYEGSLDAAIGGELLTTADVIISLTNQRYGAQDIRRLEVRKVRGQEQMTGLHSYEINRDGWHAYPRLEAKVKSENRTTSNFDLSQRLRLDGGAIDRLMGGGLPKGSVTTIGGAPGTGKTILSLQFVAQGIAAGQPCLIFNFDESREQLMVKADRFNLPLRQAMNDGLLHLYNLPPVELDPNKLAHMITAAIEQHNIQRLVIDSIDPVERITNREERTENYTAALISYLRSRDITFCVTKNLARIVGLELDSGTMAIGQLAENVILLRYAERDNQLDRMLNVLKMRDSAYNNRTHDFIIGDNGLAVQGVGVLADRSEQQ